MIQLIETCHSSAQLISTKLQSVGLLNFDFCLQEQSTTHNIKSLYHRIGFECLDFSCTCNTLLNRCVNNKRLGFWLSFLQLSWFLRWVCYLHFTSNDGFNGFQQIHEDLQVGAAVQENLFTVEVSRLACLCVGFCRLLYCCTEVSWSSGFCLRPGICPLRSSSPKRNWKNVSLCLCSHMFPPNPVTNSNI